MEKIWLVEIRVKDWVHVPDGKSRAFTYEEVLANDEIHARHEGFDQFVKRAKYEPVSRRRFEQAGRPITDYCAPDAVEID